jgi:hypothetical protein
LKSGSLNLLEPSGPVQACNGIALPLPFFSELIQAEKCMATSGTTLPQPIKEISQSLNQKNYSANK